MKKLGLIALAIVMALGVMGIGYAYWSDQLKINGSVGTGSLGVAFTDSNSDDPTGSNDPGYAYDAAETVVEITNTHQASIALNTVYPGYKTGASLEVTNTGTVPVKVHKITLAVTGGEPALFGYMSLIGWGFGGAPVDMDYVLLPGAIKNFDADFSFDTDMPNELQGTSLYVSATIDVTQFNDPSLPTIVGP